LCVLRERGVGGQEREERREEREERKRKEGGRERERETDRQHMLLFCPLLKSTISWVHTCNPSYSGGRDQEDGSSKPDGQIVLETLSQKTHHEKGLMEWLKV
jgi:hypothetical protein